MTQGRSTAVVIGAIATILLVWMVNPWVAVPDSLSPIVTVAFWILAIALVVVLYMDARRDPASDTVEIEGPGFRAVPLQQLARRHRLAPHPSLPRVHLDRGRLAQGDRGRVA